MILGRSETDETEGQVESIHGGLDSAFEKYEEYGQYDVWRP